MFDVFQLDHNREFSFTLVFCPQLSPQVISFSGDTHYARHPADPYAIQPSSFSRDAEESSRLLPPEDAALASSMDAEGFDDIEFAVPESVAPHDPYAGAFLHNFDHSRSYGPPPGGASLSGSSKAELKSSGGNLETISQKMSFCSLLVSPLDVGNVGLWQKPNPSIHDGDDSSSISTNWSAIEFKS